MSRRIQSIAALMACALTGPAAAQNFATYESNAAASQQGTGERVERVYSVPSYEPYQPETFDSGGYDSATRPTPVVPQTVPADGGGRPYGTPVDVTPTGELATYSPPAVIAPQPFAPAPAPTGEIGFQQESETSRLLLALDDTFAKRKVTLIAQNQAKRKALLAQFEKDAADPQKVIGLAARMRSAMSELEAAHAAQIELEERQYNAAVLKVLDAAPSRAQ